MCAIAEAAADLRRRQQVVRVEFDRLIVQRRHVATVEQLAGAVLVVDAADALFIVAIDVVPPQQLTAMRARTRRRWQPGCQPDSRRAEARRIDDAVSKVGAEARIQLGLWQALNAVQSPASIAGVGTIDRVSESVWSRMVLMYAVKKNSRFLTIGPPTEKPGCCRCSLSLAAACAARALKRVSRTNQEALPRSWFVPALVTALTDAPDERPIDASCALVLMRNSWSASGNGSGRLVPSNRLLLIAPSIRYCTPKRAPPATEMLTPVTMVAMTEFGT